MYETIANCNVVIYKLSLTTSLIVLNYLREIQHTHPNFLLSQLMVTFHKLCEQNRAQDVYKRQK